MISPRQWAVLLSCLSVQFIIPDRPRSRDLVSARP